MTDMWHHLRFLERAVWLVGLCLMLAVAVFDSPERVWAVLFGVALGSSNFSLSRWIMVRLILRQGRLLYGALYSSKFVLLASLLALIAFRTHLSLLGVSIGLSALPLSVLLLALKLALWKPSAMKSGTKE